MNIVAYTIGFIITLIVLLFTEKEFSSQQIFMCLLWPIYIAFLLSYGILLIGYAIYVAIIDFFKTKVIPLFKDGYI